MIFYLTLEGDGILVQARATGKGIVGDFLQTVKEGGNFAGISYSKLKEAAKKEGQIIVK